MNNLVFKIFGVALCMLLSSAILMPCEGVEATDLLSSEQPLSIKVRDVDIRDVLRVIAEEYGLNIVLGTGVEGRISYEIENTTLRAGFEAILKSNGLGYIVEDNIIRVDDLRTLRAKLQEELEIHRVQQQLRQARKLDEPLQTKEIRLDYIGDTLSSRQGKAENLKELLEPLLSHRKGKGVDRGANIELLGERNTLVVTDVEENLQEIEAVAKRLDRPSSQVRIEARVVEVNHADLFALGIQWGGRYESRETTTRTPTGDRLPRTTIGGRRTGTTGGTLQGTSRDLGVDLPIIGEFAPVGTIGYTLLDNLSLDIELQALEDKGKLKLISKPSLQVIENENAEILVGSQVPVPRGLDPETGQVEVAQEDIGTKLNITPQITQDRNIMMRIEVERSSIGDEVVIQGEPFFTINKRNASSQVRVKDGETVVIGGLVFTGEVKGQQSVPFLSKIPILGLLFRNKTESTEFDETVIFITPNIVSSESS